MINWFREIDVVYQALLATSFTWIMTIIGSSFVYIVKSSNTRFISLMLGFGSGVMITVVFMSLLIPSLKISNEIGINPLFPVIIGFSLGALLLLSLDKYLEKNNKENSIYRSFLLLIAVTLHNIPEGLAIGMAFGSVALGYDNVTIGATLMLVVGISLQNLPEGMAVSIPLKGSGMSSNKAFLYGQTSGVVQPISGVLGVISVFYIRSMLPYALAFAAGAMVYVVIDELVPKSHTSKIGKYATIGTLFGILVMFCLETLINY